MKRIFLVTASCIILLGCGSKNSENKETNDQPNLEQVMKENEAKEVHGDLIKPEDIKVTSPLDQAMVKSGNSIYDVKCAACHKLTDEKVVGPGWAGVTKKRQPDWIMNMITNVDIMLESDPEAQKLLEQCLVRMPNQNLTKDEARSVFEFMRHNDGEK